MVFTTDTSIHILLSSPNSHRPIGSFHLRGIGVLPASEDACVFGAGGTAK